MPPLCEDSGKVSGGGNVLSQTMCLKRRTILNTCRWFQTEQTKRDEESIWGGGGGGRAQGSYRCAHVHIPQGASTRSCVLVAGMPVPHTGRSEGVTVCGLLLSFGELLSCICR